MVPILCTASHHGQCNEEDGPRWAWEMLKGHIMDANTCIPQHGNNLEKVILQGPIDGKRGRAKAS